MNKSFIIAAVLTLSACLAACHCDKKSKCETAEDPAASQIIRLNVFYTLKDTADATKAKEIARKLVKASRTDAGCLSYDFLESTTVPGEYMVIETWENDSLLNIHSQAPHFIEYVPQLRSLGEMHTQRFMID
ncbi:MAG: antibiotic biosynthesis monooxygenase [Bacteroidales bacterium]|nr:antibiotic biosynthesis monooxygenase [Bacteroidales bacterium]